MHWIHRASLSNAKYVTPWPTVGKCQYHYAASCNRNLHQNLYWSPCYSHHHLNQLKGFQIQAPPLMWPMIPLFFNMCNYPVAIIKILLEMVHVCPLFIPVITEGSFIHPQIFIISSRSFSCSSHQTRFALCFQTHMWYTSLQFQSDWECGLNWMVPWSPIRTNANKILACSLSNCLHHHLPNQVLNHLSLAEFLFAFSLDFSILQVFNWLFSMFVSIQKRQT